MRELAFPIATRRRRARSRGAAAVEFALIMPLFVAILCGMVDWSYYFYQRYALSVAIRDGVRTGVTVSRAPATGPDAWTVAQTRAAAVLTAGGAIKPITVTWGPSVHYGVAVATAAANTQTLVLSGTVPYTPLIGFVPLGNRTITYSMTMMLELDN